MESFGPHFAFLSGIPVQFLPLLLLLFLPGNKERENIEAEDETATYAQSTASEANGSAAAQIRHAVSQLSRYLRNDMGRIFANRPLLIGLSAMIMAKMGRPVQELMLQFMTFKFDWPISKVRRAILNGFFLSLNPRNSSLLDKLSSFFTSRCAAAMVYSYSPRCERLAAEDKGQPCCGESNPGDCAGILSHTGDIVHGSCSNCASLYIWYVLCRSWRLKCL
jgi:hypothetical protein